MLRALVTQSWEGQDDALICICSRAAILCAPDTQEVLAVRPEELVMLRATARERVATV